MKLCKQLLSWVMIIFGCYLLLELLFFRIMPWLVPMSAMVEFLGHEGVVMSQYSKTSIVPRHYIAIFGDSYAFGQGEWLINVQHQAHAEYNVTHLLSKNLKRDVVTFGFPASGNIKGYIEDPIPQIYFMRSLMAY